jgi:hypothetical protein
MDLWNAVKQPPASALKKISGGRLSGKSDINPEWRVQAMTERFGPCGIGWKWTLDRLWNEPGADGVVFAFALVSVYVKLESRIAGEPDPWSDAIPGQGGHQLIEKEKSGLYSNDEGYKMAITDALGTAMKMLGVAADVYLGNWDGTSYRADSDTGRTSPPPAGKNAFGSRDKPPYTPPAAGRAPQTTPPPAQNPKPFAWPAATSPERRDYVFGLIAAARKIADPVQQRARLEEISRKLGTKGGDFSPEDLQAVAKRLGEAEGELNAECAAAGK